MMGATARFQDNFGWCQFAKECLDLSPSQLPAQYWVLLLVHAMDREDMLRRVDRYAFELHRGGSSLCFVYRPSIGSSDADRPSTPTVLQTVQPQHSFQANRRAAVANSWVGRFNDAAQVPPGNHLVHFRQELRGSVAEVVEIRVV